jgi:hypothetical protein
LLKGEKSAEIMAGKWVGKMADSLDKVRAERSA